MCDGDQRHVVFELVAEGRLDDGVRLIICNPHVKDKKAAREGGGEKEDLPIAEVAGEGG